MRWEPVGSSVAHDVAIDESQGDSDQDKEQGRTRNRVLSYAQTASRASPRLGAPAELGRHLRRLTSRWRTRLEAAVNLDGTAKAAPHVVLRTMAGASALLKAAARAPVICRPAIAPRQPPLPPGIESGTLSEAQREPNPAGLISTPFPG